MLKCTQKPSNRRALALLFGLLACTLLFNACSGFTSVSPRTTPVVHTPALVPSPTVTLALQQQSAAQLQTFQQWISLLQQYGGNPGIYQQQLASDQRALGAASTDAAYQGALNSLNSHIKAIILPALKAEATGLRNKLAAEASAWGKQHIYHDNYDGNSYHLGYEYTGIVNYPAQQLFDAASTVADYQYLVDQLKTWQSNFDAYKINFSDRTPYNQVHATDTRLLQQYGYTSGKVLVVSFSEQALRVYQDGKLINAFLVVTGQPGHPSLPGKWWVEARKTNLLFTSGKKLHQVGYYPPTLIAYALLYHSGEYYLHQSWWRTEYGPYKQFPHIDAGGTPFAYEGSHGCINLKTADIKWLYNYAQVDATKIIMY